MSAGNCEEINASLLLIAESGCVCPEIARTRRDVQDVKQGRKLHRHDQVGGELKLRAGDSVQLDYNGDHGFRHKL